MHIVERIFQYKEVLEEKKVKLIALRLRKYVSLWGTNLCATWVRNWKRKIQSWEKMKSKLNSQFVPAMYIQDIYSQLHNLTQWNITVEECIREFEKLLIKCDIYEHEEQTMLGTWEVSIPSIIT